MGDSLPFDEGALETRGKMMGINARSELLSRCIEEGKEMPHKTPFKSKNCKEAMKGIMAIINEMLGLDSDGWMTLSWGHWKLFLLFRVAHESSSITIRS